MYNWLGLHDQVANFCILRNIWASCQWNKNYKVDIILKGNFYLKQNSQEQCVCILQTRSSETKLKNLECIEMYYYIRTSKKVWMINDYSSSVQVKGSSNAICLFSNWKCIFYNVWLKIYQKTVTFNNYSSQKLLFHFFSFLHDVSL